MQEIIAITEKLERIKDEVRECLLRQESEEKRLMLEKTLLRLHKTCTELQQKIYINN